MPFAPFFRYFPDIAEKETRSINLVKDWLLPKGDYQFVEMYCDEPDCDCRRVFFTVNSSVIPGALAVIAWGWEDLEFYRRWLGMNEPGFIEQLKGPILNLTSPQSKYARLVLELAKMYLLNDPAYVNRIKRHYAMFREKIDAGYPRNEWRSSTPKEKRKKWHVLKRRFQERR